MSTTTAMPVTKARLLNTVFSIQKSGGSIQESE